MRLKAIVFSFTASFVIFAMPLFSMEEEISSRDRNNRFIKSVLDKEKNENTLKEITDILNYIDDIYSDLYYKLKNGKKITIFFDPAHGRMENGKWEGAATGRLSSTGLPEEYYSIQFARRLYNLLLKNRFISIAAPDDYLKVLMNMSDEYRRLTFAETCNMAKDKKAFILISVHLNNINSMKKTDGLINLPGIHITCNKAGNKYLTHIKGAHSGYLTLFNKYDSSGLSRDIAYSLKESLPLLGVKLNSWEFGAVADDRFTYFVDFPSSIIFEQGFICNPAEERKLLEPGYQQQLSKAQYNAIMESINNIFGIDISGFRLKKEKEDHDLPGLIKLSRIAIYYLKNNSSDKTLEIIDEIEKNYSQKYYIQPFLDLKDRIKRAENIFAKCDTQRKEKKITKAKRSLFDAAEIICNEPIFSALTEKYTNYARKYFRISNIPCQNNDEENLPKKSIPDNTVRASIYTPILFPVEKGQTIEEAVEKALCPDIKTAAVLNTTFKNAATRERVKSERSNTRKWENKKLEDREGLYIVRLNKKLQITKIQKVSQVLLDPEKYQNHQYLKNSYFACAIKEKNL